MKWVVREHEISEHVSEFTLTLPKDYQILCVMIKGKPSPSSLMAGGPCLYVKSPEGNKEVEEVYFRQLENGGEFEGSFQYVGSYQERGYHKIKHLFAQVKLRAVE